MIEPAEQTSRPAATAVLLWIILALIAYASLYPFRLEPERLVEALKGNWLPRMTHVRSGPVDTIANLLFYIPLGFVLFLRQPQSNPAALRIIRCGLIGLGVSFFFEVIQHAARTRSPSLLDVMLNTLSSLAGAELAQWLSPRQFRWSIGNWLRVKHIDPVAAILFGAWISLHMAPFIPQLRLHRVWTSLVLVHGWAWSVSGSILWFTLCLLLSALLRATLRHDRFWNVYGIVLALSLAGQTVFVQHRLEPDELIGILCSLPVIALFRQVPTIKTLHWVWWLAIFGYAFSALASVTLSAPLQDFHWLSFTGAPESSVPKIFFSLTQKIFFYLGLLWVAIRVGRRLITAVMILLAFAVFLELQQIVFEGRAADFSDVLLVLLLAAMMSAASQVARPQTAQDR